MYYGPSVNNRKVNKIKPDIIIWAELPTFKIRDVRKWDFDLMYLSFIVAFGGKKESTVCCFWSRAQFSKRPWLCHNSNPAKVNMVFQQHSSCYLLKLQLFYHKMPNTSPLCYPTTAAQRGKLACRLPANKELLSKKTCLTNSDCWSFTLAPAEHRMRTVDIVTHSLWHWNLFAANMDRRIN